LSNILYILDEIYLTTRAMSWPDKFAIARWTFYRSRWARLIDLRTRIRKGF
jgi:hypothetical protein